MGTRFDANKQLPSVVDSNASGGIKVLTQRSQAIRKIHLPYLGLVDITQNMPGDFRLSL